MTSGATFLGILMILSGWAVAFNLLALWAGRESEAFCVEYDDEGNKMARRMSPRLTTVILGAFWLNSGRMMAAALTE